MARQRKPGQVVVKPRQVPIDVGAGVEILEDEGEGGDSIGDDREGGAGVRDDDLDVRVPGHHAVQDHVDDRPGCVEQEFDHGSRAPERGPFPAQRRRRVNEEPGVAAVELFEERFERRVTEIGLAGVGEHDDPVDTEFVVTKGELVDRSADVGCREGSEEPESSRVRLGDPLAVLVDLAGQCPGGRVVTEVHAGGRDREQARGDAESVHQRHVRPGLPDRHRHAVDHSEAGRTEGGHRPRGGNGRGRPRGRMSRVPIPPQTMTTTASRP